jgi:lysophospholipase L1-like esterase
MKLYTFGDSFTYGEELKDPCSQSWPALVANRLDSHLTNRSLPGCSNQYIVKKVMSEVANLTHSSEKLFLIAWTSCGRMEFSDNDGVFDIWPGTQRRWKIPVPYRETLMKYITVHNNIEHQYRNWLRQCILLQEFLVNRKIDYRFLIAFDNHTLNQKYWNTADPYNKLLDTKKFIGWPDTSLMEMMGDCAKGARGHPLDEGHMRIANTIFDAL